MKTLNLILLSAVTVVFFTCCSGSGQKEGAVHEKEGEAKTETTDDEHAHSEEKAHWTYEGEEGPENWAGLCSAYAPCSGESQSPIDLSKDLEIATDVVIESSYTCMSDLEFINNGHSIQVNFKADSNTIKVNDKMFAMKQFHFHCPSEHTMDGEALPAEVHFVHVSEDGGISVIGVFFKEGEENAFLNGIISNIPASEGDKNMIAEEVCPENLFTVEDEFYIYSGSLTTPPCSEGVNWFVRKGCMEASKEQIEALASAMPANNARPVQPLNDREFGMLK